MSILCKQRMKVLVLNSAGRYQHDIAFEHRMPFVMTRF